MKKYFILAGLAVSAVAASQRKWEPLSSYTTEEYRTTPLYQKILPEKQKELYENVPVGLSHAPEESEEQLARRGTSPSPLPEPLKPVQGQNTSIKKTPNFMERLVNYQETKKQKLFKMKQELDTRFTFQPQINERSKRLVEKNNDKKNRIHKYTLMLPEDQNLERLNGEFKISSRFLENEKKQIPLSIYDKNAERIRKEKELKDLAERKECTFQPKINPSSQNIKRDGNLWERLFKNEKKTKKASPNQKAVPHKTLEDLRKERLKVINSGNTYTSIYQRKKELFLKNKPR